MDIVLLIVIVFLLRPSWFFFLYDMVKRDWIAFVAKMKKDNK